MLTLDLTNMPRWHNLAPGVRVQLRPLTTALMVASSFKAGMRMRRSVMRTSKGTCREREAKRPHRRSAQQT